MNKTGVFFLLLLISFYAKAQLKIQLSPNVSVGVSRNLETYFFVEKLAVERIDNYVFDIKGTDYSHQPVVYFGFKRFRKYQNDPIIIRAAAILKQVRDSLHDNGPIMEYLLNQKEFPAIGTRFFHSNNQQGTDLVRAKLQPLFAELTDSLRKFYIAADVAGFIRSNSQLYIGALNEVVKDINKSSFQFMEKWYGQEFTAYELYISPAMPITPGEDSYRGFGPQISSPNGKIPSMIVSSSKMVPFQNNLSLYKQFGFNNPEVTKMIFSHEVAHSFVNPILEKYTSEIKADSLFYTKELQEILAPNYIGDWYVTVIEHLVRLGEIRVAVARKDYKEAESLREIHIDTYKCVLIPLLEKKIEEYESNRSRYLTFESYVPNLVRYFHSLSPKIINDQIVKYKNYKTGR